MRARLVDELRNDIFRLHVDDLPGRRVGVRPVQAEGDPSRLLPQLM
jgi:hypothetical protein